jgi:hypothetical protein
LTDAIRLKKFSFRPDKVKLSLFQLRFAHIPIEFY